MRGGKPTVPENMTGTLVRIKYNSVHTLSTIKSVYKRSAVAIVEHLESLKSVNYIYIVACSHDLLKPSFMAKHPPLATAPL